MAKPPTSLKELLANELAGLYAFAYRVTGDREEAERGLQELYSRVSEGGGADLMAQPDPAGHLLGLLARSLDESLGRKAEQSFESLDDVLRNDVTRPIDLRKAGMSEDPHRVHLMLWELKRTCLTAALCCLPPGVRLSFVLTDCMGYSPAEAAALLDIKESAYRVRLTRARKRIEDYLTPRCYHVDPQNPCSCPGRLMIAIDKNFVVEPANPADIPHEPHDADGPRRDMGSLYRGLPPVQPTAAQRQRLLG